MASDTIRRVLALRAHGITAGVTGAAQRHALLMKRIAEREAFENAPQVRGWRVRDVEWCALGAVGFWLTIVLWGLL